jgi:hypothetical protein
VILLVLAALCIASVPLTGGRLGRLAELQLRYLWTAPLALALQVLITTVAPGGNHAAHAVVHIGTYLLVGVFLWANRAVPGARIIAAGAFSNGLAIILNQGVMPASAAAQRLVGLVQRRGFLNSAHLTKPHLLWLGDIIPIPGPPALRNVLSIGDFAIFAGMIVLLHHTCRPERDRPDSGVRAQSETLAPQ